MGIRGQHKNRRDGNEPEIFEEIRAWGIQVEPLDVPFDALCSYADNLYAVEVKNGPKADLTGPQKAYIERSKATVFVIRDRDQARDFARGVVRAGSIPFRGTINGGDDAKNPV